MSFWAGIILKRSVVMAADRRRVYPEKGFGFEDGRSNLVQVNEHTWLAAAGFFPLAGVVQEGFRRVFGEGRVDLALFLESEADFREALGAAYQHLKTERSAAADILLGGVTSQDEPYLVPISSTAGFRPRIIRDPYSTACLNFPEPLLSEMRALLSPLKGRLAKEGLEERRAKAAQAALRGLLAKAAAGSEWVSAEGDLVTISAKGSRLVPLKP